MSHLQAQSLLHTMLVDALHMLQRLSSANDYVVASLMHIRETRPYRIAKHDLEVVVTCSTACLEVIAVLQRPVAEL